MFDDSRECCGTCDYKRFEDGEWVCGCETSENYGLPTDYSESCDDWEA